MPFITLPSLREIPKTKVSDKLRNKKFLDELCRIIQKAGIKNSVGGIGIIRYKGMGIIRLSGKWDYSAT